MLCARNTAVTLLKSVGELARSASTTREFDELGLIQGQRLMLIDLDRCTRCGACVDACISAHDYRRSRLYLDGPRFEKYLVPITCRSCLDPVCMIGCPVGAINRGDTGEIRIENWCIGCELCAKQCPYGSIHMSDLSGPFDKSQLSSEQVAAMEAGTSLKAVTKQATVCDLCSSLRSRDPACVYACPHNAALRVNAQEFFVDIERDHVGLPRN
jgi:Fe-S-cluster-containing dehydrogenase component